MPPYGAKVAKVESPTKLSHDGGENSKAIGANIEGEGAQPMAGNKSGEPGGPPDDTWDAGVAGAAENAEAIPVATKSDVFGACP